MHYLSSIIINNKTMTAKEKLIKAIANKSTEILKQSAILLMDNFEEGAGVAFNFILDELEKRMTESEYINFCDSL